MSHSSLWSTHHGSYPFLLLLNVCSVTEVSKQLPSVNACGALVSWRALSCPRIPRPAVTGSDRMLAQRMGHQGRFGCTNWSLWLHLQHQLCNWSLSLHLMLTFQLIAVTASTILTFQWITFTVSTLTFQWITFHCIYKYNPNFLTDHLHCIYNINLPMDHFHCIYNINFLTDHFHCIYNTNFPTDHFLCIYNTNLPDTNQLMSAKRQQSKGI